MTEQVSASMLAEIYNGANEKQQVSLLKEEMWKIISLLLCADLKVIWTRLYACVCVCVCVCVFLACVHVCV